MDNKRTFKHHKTPKIKGLKRDVSKLRGRGEKEPAVLYGTNPHFLKTKIFRAILKNKNFQKRKIEKKKSEDFGFCGVIIDFKAF